MIYDGSASTTTAASSINSSSSIAVTPPTNRLLDTTGITIGDTISGADSKNLKLASTPPANNLFKTTYTITKNGVVTANQTDAQVIAELNNNLYNPATNQ